MLPLVRTGTEQLNQRQNGRNRFLKQSRRASLVNSGANCRSEGRAGLPASLSTSSFWSHRKPHHSQTETIVVEILCFAEVTARCLVVFFVELETILKRTGEKRAGKSAVTITYPHLSRLRTPKNEQIKMSLKTREISGDAAVTVKPKWEVEMFFGVKVNDYLTLSVSS